MRDLIQQATELARSRRFREAEALLATQLERTPNDARALHLLASIAEYEGDRSRAAAILTQAAAAHPGDFVINAHLSSVLREMGRLDESILYGSRAAQLKPDDAAIRNDLAIALMERGHYETAEQHLRQAIRLDPALPDPHNNLGLIAQQTGRLEEAVSHFEDFLALKPGTARAYVNLLDSYTVRTDDDAHVKEIERILARGDALPVSDRMLLLFAAAKANIDLGRYREALELALQACELKRASINYDETGTLRMFDDVREAMSAAFMQRMSGRGLAGPRPIFIVGMPRSGSTLVEQMLSSCRSVFGAGELTDFPEAVAREHVGVDTLGGILAQATPDSFSRIGAAYVESVSRRAPDASRITDKMPTNFLMVGLIHLALPNAKIIHIRRDPVDTCVSCFTRHFAKELNFTYDLGELGRYYRAYRRLMDHWAEVLPAGVALEVQYEALIENFESEARRLLSFCGIPWDDAVLRFHQNRRPVATHSLAQVRRPLYRSSIGRWRTMDDLLRPLLLELGDLADERRPRA